MFNVSLPRLFFLVVCILSHIFPKFPSFLPSVDVRLLRQLHNRTVNVCLRSRTLYFIENAHRQFPR